MSLVENFRNLDRESFVRFIMQSFPVGVIMECLGISEDKVERIIKGTKKEAKSKDVLAKANFTSEDLYESSDESRYNIFIGKLGRTYYSLQYDPDKGAWDMVNGILAIKERGRSKTSDGPIDLSEDEKLDSQSLLAALTNAVDLLNKEGMVITTQISRWAQDSSLLSQGGANPFQMLSDVFKGEVGSEEDPVENFKLECARKLADSRCALLAYIPSGNVGEGQFLFARFYSGPRISVPLMLSSKRESDNDRWEIEEYQAKFEDILADCKKSLPEDAPRISIGLLQSKLEEQGLSKHACYAMGRAFPERFQGQRLNEIDDGSIGAGPARRFGRKRISLFGQSGKYRTLQKYAANTNTYLTAVRHTRSGPKFLGHHFNGRNWDTKGKWMSVKEAMSKKSSFGTADKKGYINFFSLNDFYPKMENGDIPLLKMNPFNFGYVKRYFGTKKRMSKRRNGLQMYALGPNAFFKGNHRGVSSTFDDETAMRLAPVSRKQPRLRDARFKLNRSSQYGSKKLSVKKKSCFGKRSQIGSVNDLVPVLGYGVPFNEIANAQYGYKGTQGLFAGPTGMVGAPATGLYSRIPASNMLLSFGTEADTLRKKIAKEKETIAALEASKNFGEQAKQQLETMKKTLKADEEKLKEAEKSLKNQGAKPKETKKPAPTPAAKDTKKPVEKKETKKPAAMGKKWLQKANKNMKKKGTLGSFKKYMMKKYGKKAFTKRGTIKKVYMMKEKASKNPTIRKRANFALNVVFKKRRVSTKKRTKSRSYFGTNNKR